MSADFGLVAGTLSMSRGEGGRLCVIALAEETPTDMLSFCRALQSPRGLHGMTRNFVLDQDRASGFVRPSTALVFRRGI